MLLDTPMLIRFESKNPSKYPSWWKNYVETLDLSNESLKTKVYNQWQVNQIKDKNGCLILIFPSEEVYAQFLLTYV